MNATQMHHLRIIFAAMLIIFSAFFYGCATKSLVVNEHKAEGYSKKIQEIKVKWGFVDKTKLLLTHASTVQQPKITTEDKIESEQRASALLRSFSSSLDKYIENILVARGIKVSRGSESSEMELVLNIKTFEDFCTWAGCAQKVTIQASIFEHNNKEAIWFSVYDTSIPFTDNLDKNNITNLAEYIVSRMDVAHLL